MELKVWLDETEGGAVMDVKVGLDGTEGGAGWM